MSEIITKEQYETDIKREREKARKTGWGKVYPLSDKDRHLEYTYLMIRDRNGDFTDGLVLYSAHEYNPFEVQGSRHEELLEKHGYVVKNERTSYAEFQRKIAAGYKPLEITDVLEAGVVVFDKNGHRRPDSRTRYGSLAGDAHQRRKDQKLVYAVIKKEQRKKMNMGVKMFDAERVSGQSAFIMWTPQEYNTDKMQMAVLKNETVQEFMERNGISATNVLGMGRFQQQQGQIEITKLIGHQPYKIVVDNLRDKLPDMIRAEQSKSTILKKQSDNGR